MNSNFKILAVLFTLFSISLDAQILSNGVTQSGYNNNNLFFDASTNYDPKITLDNNNGKGLLFPRTDLTNWTWLLDDMNNVLSFYSKNRCYNIDNQFRLWQLIPDNLGHWLLARAYLGTTKYTLPTKQDR